MIENNNLPSNWVLSTLGDVCSQPQYGYTTKATDKGNLHLLRTTDITSGQIEWGSVPYCSENPVDEGKYLLKDGDIVISRAGSVGYSYLLEKPKRAVFASYLIRFKPFVNKKFFKYFLHSPNYWNEISENKLGIAVPNVNANKLKAIPIPIPSLNEQKRIVAKIENLFAELEAGVASLELAQAQLQTYRQALLKHAFEGKLTEAWRTANADKLEDAATLLQRIQAERQARYEAELGAWKEAVKTWEAEGRNGRKPRKPQPAKDLSPLTPTELSELAELPAGWFWVKIGQLCDVVRGGSPRPAGDPKYYDGAIPFLKVADITHSSSPYLQDYTYTIKEAGLTKTRQISPFTLLLSNSGATLGVPKICLIEATMNDGIAAFLGLPKDTLLYHYYFWQSKTLELRAIDQGAAQPNLNTGLIQEVAIPICSKLEQKRITEEVESRLSVIDQLEQTVTIGLQQAEALRQSILKKAFAGQLVPQDPNDEPASALLARIRAAKDGNR